MIKIRLARGGAKKAPFYRIVAIDSKNKRGGKAIEILGFWHPAKGLKKIDRKKIKNWIGKGGQVSKTVRKLLEEK